MPTDQPFSNGNNTDIMLTARQQRVLQYLARRRMRSLRITPRPTPTSIPTPAPEEVEPTPHKEAIIATPLPESVAIDGNSIHKRQVVKAQDEHGSLTRTNPTTAPVARFTGTLNRAIAPISASSTVSPRQRAKKVRHRRIVLRHLSRKHLRKARATTARTSHRLWLIIGSTVMSILVVLLSLATAGSLTAYHFYNQTQTKYEHQVVTLHDLLPLDNLKMYDSKGVMLMQMTDQGIHTTVKLNDVAPILKNATIATEDKNFWTNQGIDIIGIIRAAITDLTRGSVVEGGSTITQQLIKNLIVGNQTSIIRKLEEVVLTPQINGNYSKQDILEMYLNSIYYGHQAYGIDAAATIYFGLEDTRGKRAAMQLDLAQAAMLAGIPSNPSAYDPLLHPQAAFARFQTVLNLLVTQRYISKVDALGAITEEQSPHFFKTAPSLTNRAPHFASFVLDQLVQLFHLKNRSQLSRSGMLVNTTLDINLQDKIQKIAQQHIAELRAAHNLSNAAEVLIDFHTGAIVSLLGSIDYNDTSIDGQFDVATQSYRQPGSSFKPYVYVTAFAQGASPAQAIDDAPTTIYLPGGDPPTYSPSNYDMNFHGNMTLRCALQNSLNVPAVRVLRHVGIDAAMKTAQDMGITTYQGTPGYSLVLGGLGVRLIDHTSAIGTFADGGVHVGYYAISKVISGTSNKVIYQHQLDPGKRVISPQLAYMMTSVLSDNSSRIPEFFDCNVLQLYANSQSDCWNGNRGTVRPAAAKTGTTQNFRDNWTVGYTSDYVMGVWAGNDNNTPMVNVTGVQGAAPIWHDSMLVAEQGHPIRDFVNPGGLQRATVTYADGVTSTDWFLPGTVPTSVTATPTPTASVPTATPTTGTPTITPTAPPTSGTLTEATAHPYCPSSYSFSFNPPETNSPNVW
ncbi:MAG: transglycosylase domain-containing protein [Ktedonobacteraceae bacterium]